MADELDYMIKIILVGDSRVGKSSYFNRLQRKVDYLHPSTIGVDYCSIKRYYGEKYVKVNIWDTAGQERFNTIITTYFKEIGGIILMFDVNEPPPVSTLKKWINHVNIHTQCNHEYEHPILLLGNKTDKGCNNGIDELNQIIQEHNVTYKEISCKKDTDEYLEEVFDEFINIIIKNHPNSENRCKGIKQKDEIIQLFTNTNKVRNSKSHISSSKYEEGLTDCCIIV